MDSMTPYVVVGLFAMEFDHGLGICCQDTSFKFDFFLFASTQMSFSLKEYVEKSRTRAVLCNFQTFVGLVLD